MKTPTLFGFPVWKGKIKRRTVKKYLCRFRRSWFLQKYAQREFSILNIGDFVNDCTELNGRILQIFPAYYYVRGGGSVLVDIDLQTTNTSCSLVSCGIEPKLSREKIEIRRIEHLKWWALDDSGKPGTAKYWHGNDIESYERVVMNAENNRIC
jgi:hypothetical protein